MHTRVRNCESTGVTKSPCDSRSRLTSHVPWLRQLKMETDSDPFTDGEDTCCEDKGSEILYEK